MKFRFIKYLRLLFNNIFIRLFFRTREEQKKVLRFYLCYF